MPESRDDDSSLNSRPADTAHSNRTPSKCMRGGSRPRTRWNNSELTRCRTPAWIQSEPGPAQIWYEPQSTKIGQVRGIIANPERMPRKCPYYVWLLTIDPLAWPRRYSRMRIMLDNDSKCDHWPSAAINNTHSPANGKLFARIVSAILWKAHGLANEMRAERFGITPCGYLMARFWGDDCGSICPPVHFQREG